jgi:chromosome segregation ATPase
MGSLKERESEVLGPLKKQYSDICAAKASIYDSFTRWAFWNEEKILELIGLDSDIDLITRSIHSFHDSVRLETIESLKAELNDCEKVIDMQQKELAKVSGEFSALTAELNQLKAKHERSKRKKKKSGV